MVLMEAEFISDALDDLYADACERAPVAPYVAPVPAGFVPLFTRQLAAMSADIGFLALVAPDLFAWRVGGLSVAQHHVTGAPQPVAVDQAAAARNRRHREYRDGLRVRPLS
jgi:hypothetical protein